MKLKNSLLLIVLSSFFSCVTPPKNVVYFQDLDKYGKNIRMGNDSAAYEPIIKKYDELLITVTAPVLDQENVAQFNLPMTAYLTIGETGTTAVQQSPSIQTYIVDRDGMINYPVVGRIPLAGLTKSQAIEHIRTLVSDYVSDAVVNMKIMSFKVTVIGEVNKPGVVPISHERISILDALGSVSGLTIYGDLKNVILIRENNNGSRDYIQLDLTTADLFASPYYYLQQDDVVVVEPNKTRQLDSKYGAADGYRLSLFSMGFSAVSIIASTIVAIISIRKNKTL
jgi:polysaccharide export outer membrane protein